MTPIIEKNKSLSKLTRIGIGGTAAYVVSLENKEDFSPTFEFILNKQLPFVILGARY